MLQLANSVPESRSGEKHSTFISCSSRFLCALQQNRSVKASLFDIYIYMNTYYISFVFSSKKDTCLIRDQKAYIFHIFFSNCDVFEKGRIFFFIFTHPPNGCH